MQRIVSTLSQRELQGLLMFVSSTAACYSSVPRRLFCKSLSILQKIGFTPSCSSTATKSNIRSAALICLQLPANASKMLQHLKNDEILSKAITRSHSRYYVQIICGNYGGSGANTVSSSSYDKAALADYMSEMYDKVWNEFVSKDMLAGVGAGAEDSTAADGQQQRQQAVEFFVLCDALEDGSLTSREVLNSDAQLTQVFHSPLAAAAGAAPVLREGEINATRRTLQDNLGEVEFVSTDELTRAISQGYAETESIFFVEHNDPANICSSSGSGLPSFGTIAMGGTFDCIHNGHRKLLSLAASMVRPGGQLIVGITGDAMLANKANAAMIAPYSARREQLHAFLSRLQPGLMLRLEELAEPFGPTTSEADIDAIMVSSETLLGACKINSVRRERGMSPLAVLVTMRGSSATLSSSFIRDLKQRRQRR